MQILRLPLLAALLLLPVFVTVADPIRIVHGDWAEGTALAHLAAAVLEEEMELETTLTIAGPEATFPDIQEGRQDVFLTAWLPYTHAQYWRGHSTEVEKLGTVFRKAQTGLAVPTYVSINSIRQLNGHADKLNGKIIGIETDAGITGKTDKAIKDYGLNFTQVNESTEAMIRALDAAIEAREPIVVTAWTPHWMFAKYDLKFLSDPEEVYYTEGIRKIARPGFGKDHPEAAAFLGKFALTDAQLNQLLLDIEASDQDPSAVAREWIAKHPKIVKAWTAPEKGFWRRLF